MLKLVVSIFLLSASYAQEQFTCTKTEPGFHNRHEHLNMLRRKINLLSQQMETFKNQSKEFAQALKILSERKMYKLPVYEFNGYLYKLTPEAQSWQETRSSCQRWGGDLAVYGMKTMESRRNIMQALTKRNMNVWIGVSDVASEGNWLWVNGEPANSSEIIWDLAAGQPDSFYPEEDCVFALGWDWDYPKSFKSYDSFCDLRLPYVGLCEKALQQN